MNWGNSFFDNLDFIENNTRVFNQEDHSTILIKVPGFTKDDIKVTTEGDYLYVTGKSKYDDEIKKSFILYKDLDKIEVNVENGMLEIKLVKNKSSTIPIEYK